MRCVHVPTVLCCWNDDGGLDMLNSREVLLAISFSARKTKQQTKSNTQTLVKWKKKNTTANGEQQRRTTTTTAEIKEKWNWVSMSFWFWRKDSVALTYNFFLRWFFFFLSFASLFCVIFLIAFSHFNKVMHWPVIPHSCAWTRNKWRCARTYE